MRGVRLCRSNVTLEHTQRLLLSIILNVLLIPTSSRKNPVFTKGPCFPRSEARETYWLYHELWELFKCRSFKQFKNQIKILFFGKEAILDPSDPLPFLMVYHWQIPSLLIQALKSKSPWVRIDFNIGKLVEVDGD